MVITTKGRSGLYTVVGCLATQPCLLLLADVMEIKWIKQWTLRLNFYTVAKTGEHYFLFLV